MLYSLSTNGDLIILDEPFAELEKPKEKEYLN